MAKGKFEKWLKTENLILVEGWARSGLSDEQIAKNMGITVKTLYNWKDRFQKIEEAISKGKEVADFAVENALYKRAIGGKYEETKIEIMPDGSKKATQIVKEIPPDSTAAIFWLKNRKPNEWKNDGIITEKEQDALKKAATILGGIENAIN